MNYSKSDIILISYPFTDLSTRKVRPAAVVSSDEGRYEDIFIVPLTSRVHNLTEGEFILNNWEEAGLNVLTAVKRGCVLIDAGIVLKKVGTLSPGDTERLNNSLRIWLGL